MKYLGPSQSRNNKLHVSFQIIFKILLSTDKNQLVATMNLKNQKIQSIVRRYRLKMNNMLKSFNNSQVIYQIKVKLLKINGLLT